MRIARVDVDGRPRSAVVTRDEKLRVLPAEIGVLDLLGATAHEREALVERPDKEVAVDALPLLAPIEPPSIRDFSVFEAHIEGIVMGEGRAVPERWYEAPFCYFSNPHAITGPGDQIAVPGVGLP